MSRFFDYIKSLGMPYIKKEGGVNEGIVRAAADRLDDAKEDIQWIRRQFIPQTCESELVTSHAEARGIERYEHETEEVFRNRVSNAYQFFYSGGRRSGMNEFLAAIGLDAHVLESHECTDPALGWAEFAAVVDMESINQEPDNRNYLATLFNELKPARSKLALIIFTLDIQFKSTPTITLEITDYTEFVRCYGIAPRIFDIIGWGCDTLDGTGTLDGGWGSLTITDIPGLLLDAPLTEASVNYGPELIENGDFSIYSGEDFTGWTETDNDAVAIFSNGTNHPSGHNLRVDYTGTPSPTYDVRIYQSLAGDLVVGRSYCAACDMRGDSGATGLRNRIHRLNGNDMQTELHTYLSASWTSVENVFRCTVDASEYFDTYIIGFGAGDWYEMSAVTLKEYWLADNSCFTRHLSPQKTPIWNTLTSGLKVINFDGGTDSIDCGNDVIGAVAVTIEVWIRPETAGGRIVDNGTFLIDQDGDDMRLSSDGGTTSCQSLDGSFSSGSWTHVVVTRKTTGAASIYINGALSGDADQNSGTPSSGTTNVIIGNRAAGDRGFDGDISALRIYDGILTPENINAHYLAERNQYME